MSQLQFYQIDAFTDVPFGGNPAAVVLLPPGATLDDDKRQQIAMEMNLSETAFLEPLTDAGEPHASSEGPVFRSASRYRLRWFTPTQEVALCGHATVASAAALIQGEGHPADTPLLFDTVHSGQLSVRRMTQEAQPLLQLGMPWRAPDDPLPNIITPESPLIKALTGEAAVSEVAYNRELRYLIIRLASNSRKELEALSPDVAKLKQLAPTGDPIFGFVATTATEDDDKHDIAVRFWAPSTLEWEDPVTGSSFAVAGPYWAKQLGKKVLAARQCSARGGELVVVADEQAQRVQASGRCALVLSGKLHLPA